MSESPASTPRRSQRIAASPAKRLSIQDLEAETDKLIQEQEENDNRKNDNRKTVLKPQTHKVQGTGVRGRKKGNKRQKTAVQEEQDIAELDSENLTLIDVVNNHPGLISAAAKKWLSEYSNNRLTGMAELWTLVVQVAGSDTIVREEDISGIEFDALMKQMTDRLKKDGLQGQMIGRAYKQMKDGAIEMMERIIHRASQNNMLYNMHLLDTLLTLLTGLSISKARQFRSAGTMFCTEVSTACVKVMADLTIAQDTAQRQLTAEQRKRDRDPEQYNNALCDSLRKQIDQYHEKMQQLKSWIEGAFSRVFTHRVRDHCEDIRAYVIDGMGEWIKDLPSEYLNDTYLKYIAWALSDKSPRVRQTAILKLQDLYVQNNSDNQYVLYEFTKRFCERFRELVFDVDDEVAVQGIKLVTTLVGLKEMGEDDVRDIYWVLVDENVKLRHAASKLAGQLMTTQGEQELERIVQLTPLRPGKAGKYSKQQKQLAGLLHMMKLLSYTQDESSQGRSSSIQERPLESEFVQQLVDALYDELNVLTQWSKLCDMILAEDACYHWGNPAITNLIHVLEHSLDKANKMTQSKGKNIAAAAQQEVYDATLVLITQLPVMLRNFQSDEDKVLSLVKIVRNLHLPVYSQRKQEAEYEELLSLVSTVFFKSKEENVLQECASTLAHCSQVGPEILTDVGRHVLGSVVEQSAVKIFTASQDVEALPEDSLSDIVTALEEGTGSDDDIYALQLALRRVYALLLWCGGLLEREDAHEALNGLLEDAASSSSRYMGTTITCLLLTNMQLMLMWALHHTGSDAANEVNVQQLKKRVDQFLSQSEKIFELYSGSSKIRESVMQAWLEVSCLFSAQKLEGTYLEQTAYEPTIELVQKYWNFCQQLLEELDTKDIQEEEDNQNEEGNQEIVRQSSIMSDSQIGEGVLSLKTRKEIRKKNVLRKLDLLKGFGRLVLSGLIQEESRWWLFSRMIALSASHGNEYFELIKAIQKSVKKGSPGAIPSLFVEAMKAAYERLIRIEDNIDLWQEFEHLCQMLANYYRGLSSEGNQVRKIVELSIQYGLQSPPSNFEFLYSGVAHFSSKIPAKDVDTLIQLVQNHVDRLGINEESSEDQLPLLLFLQRLEQHAVKAKAPRRGGLKTHGSRNKSINRRIQFAEDKENHDANISHDENQNQQSDKAQNDNQMDDQMDDIQQNLQRIVNQFVSTQHLQQQQNQITENTDNFNVSGGQENLQEIGDQFLNFQGNLSSGEQQLQTGDQLINSSGEQQLQAGTSEINTSVENEQAQNPQQYTSNRDVSNLLQQTSNRETSNLQQQTPNREISNLQQQTSNLQIASVDRELSNPQQQNSNLEISRLQQNISNISNREMSNLQHNSNRDLSNIQPNTSTSIDPQFNSNLETSNLRQNTSNRDMSNMQPNTSTSRDGQRSISGAGDDAEFQTQTQNDDDDVTMDVEDDDNLTQGVTQPSAGFQSQGDQGGSEQYDEDVTQRTTQSSGGMQTTRGQSRSGGLVTDADNLYTSQDDEEGTSNNFLSTQDQEEGEQDADDNNRSSKSASRKRSVSDVYDEQVDTDNQGAGGRTSDEIEPPAKWAKRRRISVPKQNR